MEFALQLYFSQCSFTTSARHITPVLFSNSMSAAPGGSCWPQTQVVQPNFETDEVGHRHGTLRKSHGLIKTRLTPVFQAPMPRFECELSHFGFKLLETPFCCFAFNPQNPRKWWIVSLKPEDWPVDRFGRWGPPRGLEVSAKHLCRGNPVTPKQCGRWLLRVDGVRFGPCKILNFYSGFLGPGSSFPFGYKFKLMASGYAFVLAGSWTWSLTSGLCLLAFLLSKRAARNLGIIELYSYTGFR